MTQSFSSSTSPIYVQSIAVCAIATMISLTLPLDGARAKEPVEQEFSNATSALVIVYPSSPDAMLDERQRATIHETLDAKYTTVKARLPSLTDQVRITVELVDWDLSSVGGVTGRSQSPGEIVIQLSTQFEGGVDSAIEQGLPDTFAHELHHLARGWTISGNRFGPGISTAAINEGLAIVFAEGVTGVTFPGNRPPPDDIAENWAREILALPRNADYQAWMFQHPDGRESVGYRTGHFVVRRAMQNSGLNIIELSEKTTDEIWELAGF